MNSELLPYDVPTVTDGGRCPYRRSYQANLQSENLQCCEGCIRFYSNPTAGWVIEELRERAEVAR